MTNYKEKLKLAKEALESGSHDKETIEYIFPELAENKDEKIRKAIVKSIEEDSSVYEQEVTREEMLSWLEKRKPVEWSDEDEENYKSLEKLLNEASCYSCTDGSKKLLNWLKSLKKRLFHKKTPTSNNVKT